MTSVNIQLRVDQRLRDDAQLVCNRLGMDLTTAIRVFLNQLVVENGLPFQPKAADPEPTRGGCVDRQVKANQRV